MATTRGHKTGLDAGIIRSTREVEARMRSDVVKASWGPLTCVGDWRLLCVRFLVVWNSDEVYYACCPSYVVLHSLGPAFASTQNKYLDCLLNLDSCPTSCALLNSLGTTDHALSLVDGGNVGTEKAPMGKSCLYGDAYVALLIFFPCLPMHGVVCMRIAVVSYQ